MNHRINRIGVCLKCMLLAFLFLLFSHTEAQQLPTTDKNVVRTEVPRVSVQTQRELSELSPDEKIVSYAYTDGLGRPTVNVAARAGVNGEDLISFHQYNPTTGRQDKQYLPYAKTTSTPGAYIGNPVSEQANFYNTATNVAHDSKPYATTTWDQRHRVSTSTPTGTAYHNANKKSTSYYRPYKKSVDGNIHHWIVVNNLPQNDRLYRDRELLILEVVNPQGQKTRTVSDLLGREITSQVYDDAASKWYGSYQVYDDYDRVRFIIPPTISSALDTSFPNNLSTTQQAEQIFCTEYDQRGRIAREKAPGAGWHEYVYNRRNQLVLERHETQKRGNDKYWTFHKYDPLGREVLSGEIKSSQTRAGFQSLLNVTGISFYESFSSNNNNGNNGSPGNTATPFWGGYTQNNAYPRVQDFNSYELQRVYYYDNHDFLSLNGWDVEGHSYNYVRPSGFPTVSLATGNRLKDKPTGGQVRILGTDTWLNSVTQYDHYGRRLQAISENHKGGTDRITVHQNWEGQLQKQLHQHSSTESFTLLSEYDYYTNGQLKRTYKKINDQPKVLEVEYHYNAMGQLIEKNLHGSNTSSNPSFLQSVDYTYDIRGAMTHINNENLGDGEGDLFGMRYLLAGQSTAVAGTTVSARYDGLVSTLMYNTKNNTPSVNPSGGPKGNNVSKTAIGYTYDGRNRLKNTRYATWNGSAWNGNSNRYNTTSTYDNNDNLKTLTRKENGTTVDNLSYTYNSNSNKLKSVRDNSNNAKGMHEHYTGATDYQYDDMGNQIEDANKKINTIRYNVQQLVDLVEFTDGTEIRYQYDALGNLLSKEVVNDHDQSIARVDYVGPLELLDNAINTVRLSEGRAYKQNGSFHFEYFITDHQGNLRVAFGELPERYVHTATMESEQSAKENSVFTFPSTNVRTTAHNHTPLQNESARLNGAVSSRRVGPMKVLNITAGDEVDMEVWAKYTNSSWNGNSVTGMASAIVSAFGSAAAGTGAESAASNLNNALNNPGGTLFNPGSQSGKPQAYLQYVFFNSSRQYVSSGSGFIAVSTASQNKFARIETPTRTYNQNGYLLVYIVNESNQNAEVYFDDLKITHSKSQTAFRVSQTNEYYPFGLVTDKSWRAEGYVDPGLLYQSSYAQYDELTGNYDFLSRSYDPAIGRFFQTDPAGQFASPYTGMGNLPHWGTDPDGEFFGIVKGFSFASKLLFGPNSLAKAALLTTDEGYEAQKAVLPLAVRVDVKFGTHQNGLGFDASFGVPQMGLISYRAEAGATYYFSRYGGANRGWQIRNGGEWGFTPAFIYGGTRYRDYDKNGRKVTDQTVHQVTIGGPLRNFQYENDTEHFFDNLAGIPKRQDGGAIGADRLRTASGKFNFGIFELGFRLHTGQGERIEDEFDTNGDGIGDARAVTGGNLNEGEWSHGIIALGFGPIKAGWDAEGIRHSLQNRLVHDYLSGGIRGSEYPWIPRLNRKPRFFLQFGWL